MESDVQSVGKSSLYRSNKKIAPEFSNYEYKYADNSMLYIFSDGYIDQFDSTGTKKFNLDKLREQFNSIHSKELANQKSTLIDTFNNWKGDYKQIDDVMIAISLASEPEFVK